MKLKKLMLMIFLTVLPIVTLSAQASTTNEKTLENELDIDLTKMYTGQEVNQMIQIILEEADISIENAYAEGYKQGVLEFKPDLLITENENRNIKNSCFHNSVISFSIGFVGGIVTDLIFRHFNSRYY